MVGYALNGALLVAQARLLQAKAGREVRALSSRLAAGLVVVMALNRPLGEIAALEAPADAGGERVDGARAWLPSR